MTTKLDQVLLERLKELLQPLIGLSGEETLQDLLEAMSWDGTALGITDPTPFTAAAQQLSDALDSLNTLLEDDEIGIVELMESLAPLAAAMLQIKNLISSRPLPPGSPADTLTTLAKDILDFLVDYYFASRHPKLSLLLQFIGIFSVVDIPEIKDNNGNVLRASSERRRLNIGAISQAVSDPIGYIRRTYFVDAGGNQRLADAIADLIGPDLAFGLRDIGLTSGYGYLSDDLTPDEADRARRMLIIDAPVLTGADTARTLLRLVLALSDEANGLGVMATLSGDIALNIQTPAGQITGELSGGLEPVLITKDSVTLAGSGGTVQFKAGLGFQTDPSVTPALRFGSPDGMRFEIGQVQTSVSLSSDSAGVDAGASVDLKGMLLAIQGGDGDGFLSTVLPDHPIELRADMGIDASVRKGVRFRGSSALEITLPTHIDVGPLEIQAAVIAIKLSSDKVPLEIGATIKLNL